MVGTKQQYRGNAHVKVLQFLLLTVSALLICGCTSSGIVDSDSLRFGWHEAVLEHQDLDREFRFYIPESVSKTPPVVVLLHGGSQNMDALFEPEAGGTQEWEHIADDEGVVLFVPNGTQGESGSPAEDSRNWNDCRPETQGKPGADDSGFILSMLDWAAAHFAGHDISLNMDRVFATGASNGGMMSYRLAREYPERFAAIGAFIANLPSPSECSGAHTPVPTLIVNGTEDIIMPFEGGSILGGRGKVMSAEATRDHWIDVNNADTSDPEITRLPDLDPDDGSVVICEYYRAEHFGAPVQFCRVEGGGHTMPSINHPIALGRQNRDVEGARLAWEFLKS
ncbi:alpha/beta hydrolase family esterase [Chitinivibrio alkaliphilus]|uniref:Poly(3-hydroxybutyrate) depolymerase n=1 Tax=Chitinivibrio alkaliphilus ACht1 TaxID=1313304 RepID=U7D5F3_9BACT|nr:PHB depolymerase family esterase [Chitinivibrio alkaliphilus]ERP31749.1 hypothetical protein CALK_1414 [Chitinivibrio alkaliphilus ACht1]